MKYTNNYCKYNAVAVRCPTLEIYKKVTRCMKISGILRDYLWKCHGENTLVSYTFESEQIKPYSRSSCCFSNVFPQHEIVGAEEYLKSNDIVLEPIYEIY